MMVTIGMVTYDVALVTASATYDSSVAWQSVGTRYVGRDLGADCDNRTSSATVRVSNSDAGAFVAGLTSARMAGGTISVTMLDHEPLFGPHITYVDPISCHVLSATLSKGTEDGKDYAEVSVTFRPVASLGPTYYRYPGETFPYTLWVEEIKRDLTPSAEAIDLYSGHSEAGFGTYAPQAEVQFSGTWQDVANALQYLEQRRLTTFLWPYGSTYTWLFTQGETAPSVVVLDVRYLGTTGRGGFLHRFSVTLGKGGNY